MGKLVLDVHLGSNIELCFVQTNFVIDYVVKRLRHNFMPVSSTKPGTSLG